MNLPIIQKPDETVLFPTIGFRNSDHPADVVKDISAKDIAGTNVVFINMPLRETAVPNTTPQGPLMLMANLQQNYGVKTTIIDLNGYRIKDALAEKRGLPNGRHLTDQETLELIDKHFEVHGEPDLVAYSGIITTLQWQEKVTKIIRQLLPDIFIVSGNGLATELKTGLFNYIPELDAVAHSEGDDVIIKIVYDAKLIKKMGMEQALHSGKLKPYYIDEFGKRGGRYRFMYDGSRVRNLNDLPFADLESLREDVFGNKLLEYYLTNVAWGTSANNSSATSFTMKRNTNSVSSRGCPYACAFCYRGAQGERSYRTRTAENIVDEIRLHKELYDIDFFAMPDDNYGVSYERIKEMHAIMTSVDAPKTRWGTHTRLDESAGLRPVKDSPGKYEFEDPLRIQLMAEMGCIYIGFGAESASSNTLEAMQKGGFILKNGVMTPCRPNSKKLFKANGKTYKFPRTMVEGIRNCEKVGIHANCTWIMGFPTETLEDLKTSVAFMMWQEEFYASQGKPAESVNKRMFTATWYPGTTMGNLPKPKQILIQVFGIKFDEFNQPICDENFYNYLVELDDADKLLYNPVTQEPLNFGDMPTDTFIKARELADQNRTYEILDL